MIKAERKAKFFSLMEQYVSLGDDLSHASTLAELDNVLREMAATKAEFEAVMAEQERASLS
jgi:hypothetical protein